MPAPGRRTRFAAVLAAAAVAGLGLGACGNPDRSVGNPGPIPETGTVQTNPGGITPTNKTTTPATTQPANPTTTP